VLLVPQNDPADGALNPETYFLESTRQNLLEALRSLLQWHVVWLGVEG
jgi:hypothetical protein